MRSFTPADIPLLRLLLGDLAPAPESQVEWRCLVAETPEGRVAGCGCVTTELHGHPLRAGRHFVHVIVDAAHRGCGHGAALYDEALALARAVGAKELLCQVAAADAEALAFAAHRGFVENYHMLDGELDLSTFDEARWPLPDIGTLRMTTLAGEPDQLAALRDLYDLDRTLSADVQEWDGHMPPFEQYCDSVRSGDPEAVFLVRDGDRMVGMSMTTEEEGLTAYTSFLGVLRSHRRHGLALTLKLHTIAWARRRGLTRLLTNNNAAGAAIIELNRKLGYTIRPGTLYLTKSL